VDIFDPREKKARKALEEWESSEFYAMLEYNRNFKRASKKLAEEYSYLIEDWVTGFDLLVKPAMASKLAKETEALFGKEVAKAALEGVETFSDVLYGIPPYVERVLSRQIKADNISIAMGKRYSYSRELLLGFCDILPEPFLGTANHEKKYFDVVDELSSNQAKNINDDGIHSAVRSVFKTKEEYLSFKKDGNEKIVKCIEYFEGLIGKEAAKNIQAMALFGSLKPLKKFVKALGECEQEIESERADEIY